jgi:hypothetical protein
MFQRRHTGSFIIIKDEIEIIEIWDIGKRDKTEIYKIIGQRILKGKYCKGVTPHNRTVCAWKLLAQQSESQ